MQLLLSMLLGFVRILHELTADCEGTRLRMNAVAAFYVTMMDREPAFVICTSSPLIVREPSLRNNAVAVLYVTMMDRELALVKAIMTSTCRFCSLLR